jgi:hypothetical protein
MAGFSIILLCLLIYTIVETVINETTFILSDEKSRLFTKQSSEILSFYSVKWFDVVGRVICPY